MGDGTTSVVILAAELLKGANELVTQKIHPTSIISGYRLACKYVKTLLRDLTEIDRGRRGGKGKDHNFFRC